MDLLHLVASLPGTHTHRWFVTVQRVELGPPV